MKCTFSVPFRSWPCQTFNAAGHSLYLDAVSVTTLKSAVLLLFTNKSALENRTEYQRLSLLNSNFTAALALRLRKRRNNFCGACSPHPISPTVAAPVMATSMFSVTPFSAFGRTRWFQGERISFFPLVVTRSSLADLVWQSNVSLWDNVKMRYLSDLHYRVNLGRRILIF